MENKQLTIKYNPLVYKIKNYLENHCIGKENAQKYPEIIQGLFNESKNKEEASEIMKSSHMLFKTCIRTIRSNFDRYVCSNKNGYYLPASENEVNSFLVKQAITHMKTCLAQGVSKDVFYKVLYESSCNDVLDGQQKLKLTPYAKEQVTRISRKKKVDKPL